ncbi:hypothetical protein MBANPS3_002095 [Mucor bainieri]
MVNIQDKLQQPTFSSPIISPDNELGYYLHVPPFDHRQNQARLVIASIDSLDEEPPKVYEVRPLQSDAQGSPPLLSPSINTSASTLEEIKLAERQVFQQTCPEKFDTIENVYDPSRNRHYHFNKLKQMMSYYENSNGSSMSDSGSSGISMDHHPQDQHGGHNEQQHSTNTFYHGFLMDPPPRHSSKAHYYNAPRNLRRPPPHLKRYDSSKIVRYTLVDKELTHTKSTNSSYHQRLNQYDDDDTPRSSSANYHPNMFFGIQNSVQPLDEEKRNTGVTFHLRSPKREREKEKPATRTDSKQIKQIGIPYFTYLSTLVMIAYFAGCLIKHYQLTGAVIQLSPFNVMVGPSAETLIYTGARFTPCIRTSSLYPVHDKIYTCPRNPAPDAATRPKFNDPHSAGIFATNSTNSQGVCDLQNVCGGNSFNDPSTPDQGYRFISAIFMHSGIVQLVINMLVHIRLGMRVEKRIQSGRYAIIWLVSGIFGYLFGSLFVPHGNVSMGCSVPLMGIMAFLCVDLIRYWHTIAHPVRIALCIIVYFVITLAIGLLPGYDNFSHFGGFIGGTLITLATLPLSSSCKSSKNEKQSDSSMLIWLMRILMLAFITVLMWMLVYLFVNTESQEVIIAKSR